MQHRQSDDARVVTWADPNNGTVWLGVWPLTGAVPPPEEGPGSLEVFKTATFAMCVRPEQALGIARQLLEAGMQAAYYMGRLYERGGGHAPEPPDLPEDLIPEEEQQSSGPSMTPEELRQLWRGPHVDGDEQRGQEETGPGTDSDS